MKRTITFSMVCSLVFAFSGPLLAKDDSSGDLSTPEMVGGVLWVRPLGFMQIALGATAFAISLPVTIPLKKAEEVKEFLMKYPYGYFVKRPPREM
jgi:hypothetical protein